ncbi:MAG TPA: efflux transporter outer membrane subunit [Methylomirabilota bacterium]|nr:efflux transporter outer membrane subunit [Methylomirabilota bacterium]
MTRSVRIISSLVVAALLSGCAIGPDYKRPAVARPETFRGQATAEAASLADVPWWEAFQDPILKGLIQDALGSNYDVRIAAARVQEARANLGVARSDYFPSLDYGGGASRARMLPGVLGGVGAQAPASDLYSATMSMSWELDIWGRIRRSNEAARATLLSTEDARRGVWLTLVSDLAQAYFQLLALDVQLQIARDSTQAYQGTYDLFLDRLNHGIASKLETSRALGALGVAQATIPQLERDIVARENQIRILLGKAPGPIPRGQPMYQQPVVPAVPAGLPSALLERRPDLRQAEQQLVAANARIGVAKAEFFPKLSLTSLFGTASPEMSALTGGTATIWAVAGMFSGPLFNAGRTRGIYRASIAQWEQVRLQYEQAVLTALREVSDALTALAKLTDAEAGQDTAVRALADAVDHATDRYRQGLASYYEVLEAQQQLYPAQITLAQIRQDRLLTYVRLYKALGGGWSLSDAQWTAQQHEMPR